MTDLHDLCKFPSRPVDQEYLDSLKYYLQNGIPATYTVEEAYNFNNGVEIDANDLESTTTPLHLICTHFPKDCTPQEVGVVEKMIEKLFEYGAGWCHIDINNETPGCILIRRGLKDTPIYRQFIAAGVRAELLLRKVEEIEFVDEDDYLQDVEAHGGDAETQDSASDGIPGSVELVDSSHSEQREEEATIPELVDAKQSGSVPKADNLYNPLAPSNNQESYLETKLEYKDGALITKDRKDGVMMDWESHLMQMGCDTMFEKGVVVDEESKEVDSEIVVLNIGFGMGIIDTMIQAEKPTKHYICEAHPDVLEKLKADGWYEKPNVVVLAGRWQEQLSNLLSEGSVFFNGIYYDTYLEHYSDMLDLFDFVVGLLKPHGVFSFFNGLGADRQVVYEVYKELVEIDLANYGLQCTYVEYQVPEQTMKKPLAAADQGKEADVSVWDGIRREYWSCPVYYHPEAKFMD